MNQKGAGRTVHEELRYGEHLLVGRDDGLPGCVLVRPDGYVAAVAREDDDAALDDLLRRVRPQGVGSPQPLATDGR